MSKMFEIMYIVSFVITLILIYTIINIVDLLTENETEEWKKFVYSGVGGLLGVCGYYFYINYIDDTLLTEDFSVEN